MWRFKQNLQAVTNARFVHDYNKKVFKFKTTKPFLGRKMDFLDTTTFFLVSRSHHIKAPMKETSGLNPICC